MYYCYYQKIDLNYLFNKIKYYPRAFEKSNDIKKMNLKGFIKSYKILSKKKENKIIEEIDFNNEGNLTRHFVDNRIKLYKYYTNSKISSCRTYNLNNELIITEYYDYDDNWKLTSKKVFNKENYELSYEEFYEYDFRKNITAIIKISEYGVSDDIQTIKYDKNGNITDRYSFTNKTYCGRLSTIVEFKTGGKSQRVTRFSIDNDILFDTNSLLNSKNDIISELSFSFLNLQFKSSTPTSLAPNKFGVIF